MTFTDTPQQKAILRQSRVARAMRQRFPEGQRVEAVSGQGPTSSASGKLGTVQRHVPGQDAQGGYMVVLWDYTWDGKPVVGRHVAGGLRPVSDA
jgi:hypothetical protein